MRAQKVLTQLPALLRHRTLEVVASFFLPNSSAPLIMLNIYTRGSCSLSVNRYMLYPAIW